jgi:hypothetical protein
MRGAVGLQMQLQDGRAADDDLGELSGRIEFQALHDAETVSQRRSQ